MSQLIFLRQFCPFFINSQRYFYAWATLGRKVTPLPSWASVAFSLLRTPGPHRLTITRNTASH